MARRRLPPLGAGRDHIDLTPAASRCQPDAGQILPLAQSLLPSPECRLPLTGLAQPCDNARLRARCPARDTDPHGRDAWLKCALSGGIDWSDWPRCRATAVVEAGSPHTSRSLM